MMHTVAVKILLALTPGQRRRLNTAAAMLGTSPTRLVTNLVTDWLEQQGDHLEALTVELAEPAEAFGQLPMPAEPAKAATASRKPPARPEKESTARRRTRS